MATEEIEAGVHVLLDINNIRPELLYAQDFIEHAMVSAARKANATILHSYFHHFGGQWGVTGVVAVSESHLSIHTWPEWGYASVDIYLCRGMDPRICAKYLVEIFESTSYNMNVITRKAVIDSTTSETSSCNAIRCQ